MDAITKQAQEQGEIFETLSFFNQSIKALNKASTDEFIKDIKKLFLKDLIAHFKFEETGVFPLVLRAGSLKDKALIRSLQTDHITILDKLDKFEEYANSYAQNKNQEERKKLVTLSKEIVELMLAHTRKEDKELFPLLKNIGCRVAEGKVSCK